MQDLLFETIALQRIALISRLVANGNCNGREKDLALMWLGELTTDLEEKLSEYEIKAPANGGLSTGGRFQ